MKTVFNVSYNSMYDAFKMLNPEQLKALKEIKEELKEKMNKLIILEIDGTFEKSSECSNFTEVDAFLIRFYIARKLNINQTKTMLQNYFDWSEKINLISIQKSIKFSWIFAMKQVYPHGYHGTDRYGRPVYIERIGKADLSEVLKLASLEEIESYFVQQYEYLTHVIFPSCSIASSKRIDQNITILDLEDLNIFHFKKQARNILYKFTQIGQSYYPEILHKLIIINVPSLFSTIWSFIKGLVDETTSEKIIVFTNRNDDWKDYLKTLIYDENLPKFLGGKYPDEDWLQNEPGPWKNLKILEQVQARNPYLPSELLLNHHIGNIQNMTCNPNMPNFKSIEPIESSSLCLT